MSLSKSNFLISENMSSDLKGPTYDKICTIDNVQGGILWIPYGITPAAVYSN